MKFWKRSGKYYLLALGILLSFNLYFLLLVPGTWEDDLYYLDFLLFIGLAFFAVLDCGRYLKKEKKKKELLSCKTIVYREIPYLEDAEITAHDVEILQEQLEKRFEENCELQDYVAKWCHEMKIPLAAGMLMNEDEKDAGRKSAMREQLERMNQNLNMLLLGCRLQSTLFDLQVRKTSLRECVNTSIRNNQFFLIRKHFEISVWVEEIFVYSDPAWLVYVLDQLLSNAVKYIKKDPEECPRLEIWTEKDKLIVKDYGEGIQACDLRRIFDKGYTGSNYHNGRYKSTGMGLYMAAKIIKRLGHEIDVKSEYGSYTQFRIIFQSVM